MATAHISPLVNLSAKFGFIYNLLPEFPRQLLNTGLPASVQQLMEPMIRQPAHFPGHLAHRAAGPISLLRDRRGFFVPDLRRQHRAHRERLLDETRRPLRIRLQTPNRPLLEIARRQLPSSSMDSSRSYAITGIITFSSKFPAAQHHVMVASYPITCAHAISKLSAITGFTLPGMMLEPGCVSGSFNSPIPQRGPEASQRMSFAILVSATAYVFSAPLRNDSASFAACASK